MGQTSFPGHLCCPQEIGEVKGIPTYWVDSAARVDVDANRITHKLAHGELVETRPWLGEGPLVIGVTSGASTPDKAGVCGSVAGRAVWSGVQLGTLKCAAYAVDACAAVCVPCWSAGRHGHHRVT
jgi:hypothetical protein